MDDFRKLAATRNTAATSRSCSTWRPSAATPTSSPSASPGASTPTATFARGRTPLIANVRSFCPSAETVRALLQHGADPGALDESGLTALDYARRKLARLQARPRRRRKSPSLDENGQLRLSPDEQKELDEMRREVDNDPDYMRMWWQERLRAARRVFNDPDQLEKIVSLLEAAGGNA